MAPKKILDPRPPPPIIQYAPLGNLKIYEISEAELEKLEAGPPGQLHLNFALAMLPTALSIFISLQTANFTPVWSVAYQIACWLLGIQGLWFLFQWWYSSRSYGVLIKEIRARMPDKAGMPEQLPSQPLVIEQDARPNDDTPSPI